LALFRSYNTPGPGVDKYSPKKRGFIRFFELYFRKFWKMLELNLLTFIMCIPIVTIGPAIAGMTKVLRSFYLEKSVFMLHDFWKGFKSNWKQSLPVGLINLVVVASTVLGMQIYPDLAEQTGSKVFTVMAVITVAVAFTILMMNFYVYLMIVATDLKLKAIAKNAFFLVCIALKRSLWTFLLVGVLCGTMALSFMMNPFWGIVIPIFFISFVGFVVVFNCYPVIQKLVIDPYYAAREETNPEYSINADSDESLFSDRLDTAKSDEPKTKGKQKKTIS
jgi:uncharacterized membrane protein YesL